MDLKHWMLIKNLSTAYLIGVSALFLSSLLVLAFVDYGAKPSGFIGCYAYDAMLIGFECSGFSGAKLMGLASNFPLYHLYLPFYALFKPVLLIVFIAIWFFPVMFVISKRKLAGKST